jgi:hypothetical protein
MIFEHLPQTYSYNIDHGEYALLIQRDSTDILIESMISDFQKQSKTHLVLSMLWEGNRLTDLPGILNKIRNYDKDIKIILILNSWYKNYHELQQLSGITEIIFIDYFLYLTYNRIFNLSESVVADSWDASKEKFLFLTGKPAKVHRLGLLYKLYCAGLLTHAQWSLFMDESLKQSSRQILSDITDSEYNDFLTSHVRNPDQVDVIYQGNSLHYNGIPFDTNLYATSKFQIISETCFDPKEKHGAWITEKTWLSIANRRPFIMAGDYGTLAKLKNMGFRTFEKYLIISDYDTINHTEDRLHAIVENCKFWLAHISDFLLEITDDVNYNFLRFQELAKHNHKILTELINKYHIQTNVEDFILFTDHDYLNENNRWRNWYNMIKCGTWPTCDNIKDFSKLPDYIQNECLSKYEYVPHRHIIEKIINTR